MSIFFFLFFFSLKSSLWSFVSEINTSLQKIDSTMSGSYTLNVRVNALISINYPNYILEYLYVSIWLKSNLPWNLTNTRYTVVSRQNICDNTFKGRAYIKCNALVTLIAASRLSSQKNTHFCVRYTNVTYKGITHNYSTI